ncbi:FAD-linked sulfhydryl oxidase ALR isoform X2 [Cimex lectularius]|uniref:Sulfhydryl oxidase n=1 Tax=Cimex lectularius TaxID=79782 RepID=A0A8I6RHL6_CIMLE|nr:FAD-linked sulfhydryl oxidase ALR isoform X2 [Cimex lectularius]
MVQITEEDRKDQQAHPAKPAQHSKAGQSPKAPEKAQEQPHVDNECPLDREDLGRATWSFLHSMAAYYPDKPTESDKRCMKQFFNSFAKFYPCNECATHFQEDLRKIPPQVSDSDQLSEWLCKMHNRVNVRLGKEAFDCSRVKERWKEGWKDGSCD